MNETIVVPVSERRLRGYLAFISTWLACMAVELYVCSNTFNAWTNALLSEALPGRLAVLVHDYSLALPLLAILLSSYIGIAIRDGDDEATLVGTRFFSLVLVFVFFAAYMVTVRHVVWVFWLVLLLTILLSLVLLPDRRRDVWTGFMAVLLASLFITALGYCYLFSELAQPLLYIGWLPSHQLFFFVVGLSILAVALFVARCIVRAHADPDTFEWKKGSSKPEPSNALVYLIVTVTDMVRYICAVTPHALKLTWNATKAEWALVFDWKTWEEVFRYFGLIVIVFFSSSCLPDATRDLVTQLRTDGVTRSISAVFFSLLALTRIAGWILAGAVVAFLFRYVSRSDLQARNKLAARLGDPMLSFLLIVALCGGTGKILASLGFTLVGFAGVPVTILVLLVAAIALVKTLYFNASREEAIP